MAEKKERRGLGRGLSALMADVAIESDAEVPQGKDMPRRGDRVIAVDRIAPNPDQPRRAFAQEALEELSSSIAAKGIIQPLIVRPDPNDADSYQIVAGERRWRAAQMAQLHEVPVLIRELDDTEVLEIAIIENIQRADLNPVEEAAGYQQLMDRFGHTQEKLAEALGKSRPHIANLMRLLTLPEVVLEMVRSGDLSAGHARALITSEDPEGLARQVLAKGLSVRETEKLVKKPVKVKAAKGPVAEKDADTRALESDLSAGLGMKVRINHKADGEQGELVLTYETLDQLDDICRRLSSGTLN